MSTSGLKQTPRSSGYYVNVGNMRATFYQNNGTDAAPSFGTNAFVTAATGTAYTNMATAGAVVLRDHGKTLVSSGRVFRKVQINASSGSVASGLSTASDGVAGSDVAPNNWLTGYIELPGSGGSSSGTASFTPVARLG